MSDSATPATIAQWMLQQLETTPWLYQEMVVYKIRSQFGQAFVYNNANGNLAIRKDILAAFRKLTGDSVIWERGTRAWRKRRPHDKAGRQQEG